MNRYGIIFVTSLAVALIALGAFFFSRSGNNVVPVEPSGGASQPVYSGGSVSVSPSEQAVQQAFRNELARYQNDNTKLYATSIAGGYALQVWAGDIMGGQALLKYDASQGGWVLLDAGGGAWSVDALVAAGVPKDTATTLLTGVSQ
jgi:hypothetical protein